MPISLEDLSVLAYANGFTLWHYRSSDRAASLRAPGGLDGAADMVRPGDLIIASGGLPAAAELLVVTESAPGGVAAAPLLAGGGPP